MGEHPVIEAMRFAHLQAAVTGSEPMEAAAKVLLSHMAFSAGAHTRYKMIVIYARELGIELERE